MNGEKTVFVWDGDQLVLELSEGGKVQRRYIRGNDRGYGSNLVYSDRGEDHASGREDGKLYYVTDPHGNVVQLTDGSGKVVKTYEYDSFGNEVNPDQKDENPFRYCGEYYDKETEEIYLRARCYQPKVGRFLTRDTYTGEEDDPLSLHLYTYCGNDGVNQIDFWGNAYEKIPTPTDLLPFAFLMGKSGKASYKFIKQKLSNEGIELLKELEQPFTSAEVYNKKNKLIGYKPYKLNDGGTTYGYGHFVMDGDKERENETRKYVKDGYITLENCNKLLSKDVKVCEKAINKFIKTAKKGDKKLYLSLKNQEFDALVLERFNAGHLNEKTLKLIKNENRNRKKWLKAFLATKSKKSEYYQGWKNRANCELDVFFLGIYKKNF